MQQQSLAASGFEVYRKPTRPGSFSCRDGSNHAMGCPGSSDQTLLSARVARSGSKPIGLLHMLNIHCLQHWYERSDPAAEEALYDSRAMRQFVGIDLGRERVPDETTICRFRHLLEQHQVGDQ